MLSAVNGEYLNRYLIVAVLMIFVAAILYTEAIGRTQEKLRVGSKKFTESVILGDVLVDLMVEAGYKATHQEQLGGSRILWEALKTGDIDAYPEYTGTISEVLLPDRNLKEFDKIRSTLNGKGIGITEPLGFNNTYAIAMKEDQAKKLGVKSISDLRDYPDLTFGFTNEFMDRDDGWPGLRRTYQLPQTDVQGLDHDLAYQGLQSGDVDVIDAYTTDPEIEYHNLRLLEDDRDYFPTYKAVFLYDRTLKKSAPNVVENLKSLEAKISARQMSKLNKRVKIEGESEERVAADFLETVFGFDSAVEKTSFWSRFVRRTLEHLYLVGISLSVAILVAVPLGIWAAHSRWFGQVILGGVGILQTIPSLALLVFMIPLFGIGTRPALVALFLYSLLPIVRNAYAGMNNIPNEILESARALGLPARARLLKVKLPLALRSIFAGIKTSAVINIGIATLGALIGAGGYGQPILTGIRLDDMGLVLEGAVPAALLALAVQGLLDGIGKIAIPRGLNLSEE